MAKAANKNKEGRQHRATYTRDKKTGAYLIRVKGPNANAFAGREVPVETTSGEEHMEKLLSIKFSGVDDGKFDGVPGNYAVYSFEAKPREEVEVEF